MVAGKGNRTGGLQATQRSLKNRSEAPRQLQRGIEQQHAAGPNRQRLHVVLNRQAKLRLQCSGSLRGEWHRGHNDQPVEPGIVGRLNHFTPVARTSRPARDRSL